MVKLKIKKIRKQTNLLIYFITNNKDYHEEKVLI